MQELDTQSVDIALHVSVITYWLNAADNIIICLLSVFKEKGSSSIVPSGIICQYDNGITWKSRESFACKLQLKLLHWNFIFYISSGQ